jgi:hypothetical protein
VWEKLTRADVEHAKRGIANRRSEILARHAEELKALEPIREVGIQAERLGCVRRRSIMRIMASLTKAATVREYRSKSRAKRRLRLIQARVRSTIQRLGKTTNLCSSLRLTISKTQRPVLAAACAARGP